MMDWDMTRRIKKYNISTGAFVLMTTYTDTTMTMIADSIYIYSAGYVLGVQSTHYDFTAFLTDETYYGKHTVN